MRVLLLGEFSGIHQSLAIGLRAKGVEVVVASDGDGWKNYKRDIDLYRDFKKSSFLFLLRLLRVLPKLTGFDIVQLNSYKFLYVTPLFNLVVFRYLKLFNKNIFLGAHGMDTYYINCALAGKLKYSVFQVPSIQKDPHIQGLRNIVADKNEIRSNKKVATSVKGIVASSTGYYLSYMDDFSAKTTFIPLSVDTQKYGFKNTICDTTNKVRFFVGKMKGRVVRKGTDIIHEVLQELKERYPNDVELTVVDSVPFDEYQELLNSSHVLCDQMYAYSIGLNGLIAQAKGLIVAGGADEAMYSALGEKVNKPIIDLNVSKEQMFKTFERLIKNKSSLKELALKNREFVVKHHDSRVVAERYLKFWSEKCNARY